MVNYGKYFPFPPNEFDIATYIDTYMVDQNEDAYKYES